MYLKLVIRNSGCLLSDLFLQWAAAAYPHCGGNSVHGKIWQYSLYTCSWGKLIHGVNNRFEQSLFSEAGIKAELWKIPWFFLFLYLRDGLHQHEEPNCSVLEKVSFSNVCFPTICRQYMSCFLDLENRKHLFCLITFVWCVLLSQNNGWISCCKNLSNSS